VIRAVTCSLRSGAVALLLLLLLVLLNWPAAMPAVLLR
jgi:hypothetical protein